MSAAPMRRPYTSNIIDRRIEEHRFRMIRGAHYFIRPVNRLVCIFYIDDMKTIEVGAFEAKTHFSQLLDEVEQGAVVKISRRGKPVAILKQDDEISRANAFHAVEQLRTLCREKTTLREIERFRDRERER